MHATNLFLALIVFCLVTGAVQSAAAPKEACLQECEQTLKMCKRLCTETKARARNQYGDDPHKSEGTCLTDCREDEKFCKESCK